MSIGKVAALFLLIVSLLAHPAFGQQKDFNEPELNLKLESSDVVKLDIKTSEFGLRMTDQVCEFTGSGKDTGVIGALLRGNENIPLKDYADRSYNWSGHAGKMALWKYLKKMLGE